MAGCCDSCVKYSFFFFNFLFAILGAFILGVGIWAAVDPQFQSTVGKALTSIEDLDVSMLRQAAYLIIVVGGVLMVIGFFGCLGAMRSSQCLLVVFFVLLLLVLALCVAVIVIAFAAPHIGDDVSKKVILKLIDADDKDNLDLLQKTLKCCGADGSKDYNEKRKPVPASCTGHENVGCVHKLHDSLVDSFENYPLETGGVGVAVLLLILIGMVLSMIICRRTRKEGETSAKIV